MSWVSKTITWRVRGLELAVGEDEGVLRERVCCDLGIDAAQMRGFRIVKKALDARRRGDVRRLRFAIQVDVVLDTGFRSVKLARALKSGTVEKAPDKASPIVERVHPSLLSPRPARVIVVGAGPAGLFAALVLARHGLAVELIDRGSPIERRGRELVAFHRTRIPNPESNLLFGEGGAGTYSDGKLYTRVDDPLEIPLLEELVACGAQADILFDSRAHIGTDRLHRILPALRARMIAAGVRIHWSTRLESLVIDESSPRRVPAIATSQGEMPCEALIFAPGHSARDTWLALHEQGVAFEAKPFQIGVRVEHPQPLIDAGRYGETPEARSLGPAAYQLVCKAEAGLAAVHSFCMCPGGRIVASVNEAGLLCTNGMSNSTHSSPFANAAIVVTLGPREYGEGAFAGLAFQRDVEARFFEAGGGDYTAPAQRVGDFLAARDTIGELRSSYTFGTRAARIDRLLPPMIRDSLTRSLVRFDRTIPGFASKAGLFVGVESRSSSPVRMPRDRVTRRALGFANLYPCGEGAGWAGGIMSAALDGAHAALSLLERGL